MLQNHSSYINGLLITLTILLSSCATVQKSENIKDYESSIARLRARLVENPQDAESLTDLGIIYFTVKNYTEAAGYFKNSLDTQPDDPRTMFFMGMTMESTNDRKNALTMYQRYSVVSSVSPYRRLMEGRFEGITRDMIREQLKELVARESTLTTVRPPARTAAVFPLSYQGTDPQYRPLGLGLSEMLTVDLGYVEGLRLVERLRVEALLQEIKLGVSGVVDPSTAPRAGKLLAVERVIGGAVTVTDARELRVDIATTIAGSSGEPESATESDALENLFQLEKELVFRLVRDMGIVLTANERELIQKRPTGNLRAFLAYSMGLEREGLGDYDEAAVLYSQALSLDPQFERAQKHNNKAEAMKTAGTREKAMASAEVFDEPPEKDIGGSRGLIGDRLDNLQMGIGSGFVPGGDSRKPTESANGELLPEPPRPPQQ